MVPSSKPRKTLPSPTATPRLSQPQQAASLFWSMLDAHCQMRAPVRASSAKTSSLPLAMYITPSLTIGVASNEYFEANPELRCETHAPLRSPTLLVVICVRLE